MVLSGSLFKAHAVPSDKIDRRELPAGTRKAEDLILAVDTDGDDHIDAVGRYASRCTRTALNRIFVHCFGLRSPLTDQRTGGCSSGVRPDHAAPASIPNRSSPGMHAFKATI